MIETPAPQSSRPAWERHLQSLLMVMVAGLIGWVGLSITGIREDNVRMSERISALTATVERLEERLSISLTAPQVQRELEARDMRIEDHEKRIRTLENVR